MYSEGQRRCCRHSSVQTQTPLSAQWQGPRSGNSCSVEWGKTCRTCRSGISSLCHAAFSIKLQHIGNNLWTWPSNSPAPVFSWRPTSPTPNYINTPLPQYPTDPLTCSPYNMQNQICIMYVLKYKHTQTHWHPPVLSWRGQWLFFSTGTKVSHKKNPIQ